MNQTMKIDAKRIHTAFSGKSTAFIEGARLGIFGIDQQSCCNVQTFGAMDGTLQQTLCDATATMLGMHREGINVEFAGLRFVVHRCEFFFGEKRKLLEGACTKFSEVLTFITEQHGNGFAFDFDNFCVPITIQHSFLLHHRLKSCNRLPLYIMVGWRKMRGLCQVDVMLQLNRFPKEKVQELMSSV